MKFAGAIETLITPYTYVLALATCAAAMSGNLLGRPAGLIVAAVALASAVSSIAGFAFSAVCGAVLFHLMPDPVKVVQIMMTCSIANQAAMTWSLRRDIDWAGLAPFLAGGLFGLPVGVWTLFHADRRLYCQLLGVFLVIYGIYMLLRKPFVFRDQRRAYDVLAGVFGGVTGGGVGFPGASVTIWCGMKGWDKARQRAVFQPFILIMQVAALLAINATNEFGGHRLDHPGPGYDLTNLLCVPAGILGTSVGLACYRHLSTTQFVAVVNTLLIISGVAFIF
jgi:hypothetical protein